MSRAGWMDTLVRLLIIALLPFVACMVILFTRPDLNTKFVVDSFLAAIILLAGGIALVAGLQRLEEGKAGINPLRRAAFSMPALQSWRALWSWRLSTWSRGSGANHRA